MNLPTQLVSIPSLKIVSTTITGNAPELLGPALQSALPYVTKCVVIDTGITDKKTLASAKKIAGKKFVYDCVPKNQSLAWYRTHALLFAKEAGGKFALTLDNDERLYFSTQELWDTCTQNPETSVFLMRDQNKTYSKERLFRLPAKGRWEGPVHEFYKLDGQVPKMLQTSYFTEVPKTPEQLKAKFERVVNALGPLVNKEPKISRWHYYLGDALIGLGQFDDGIDALQNCIRVSEWSEESAWACYRIAETRVMRTAPLKTTEEEKKHEYEKAVVACTRGLARHAGIAELAWMAGLASYYAGNYDQARYWSKMAIPNGEYTKDAPLRSGFRDPKGLWEGPFEVLFFAAMKAGILSEAQIADTHRKKAAARLTALDSTPPP
jgi:tetratricopeptide (TPR) repeat protein